MLVSISSANDLSLLCLAASSLICFTLQTSQQMNRSVYLLLRPHFYQSRCCPIDHTRVVKRAHCTCGAGRQVVVVVLPPFPFQNTTPCICPDSPMLLTCCSLSLGSRPMHRFKVSMIRPVCCSLACVVWWKHSRITHTGQTHSHTAVLVPLLDKVVRHVEALTFIPPPSIISDVVGNA